MSSIEKTAAGHWRVRFRDTRGNRRSLTFETWFAARRFVIEWGGVLDTFTKETGRA